MSNRCLKCNQVKRDIQNIRGNEEIEPLFILDHPQFANLPLNTPIHVCAQCIQQTLDREQMDSSSRDSTNSTNNTGSQSFQKNNSQIPSQQARVLPDSSTHIESESIDGGEKRVTPSQEQQQSQQDSDSFKRPAEASITKETSAKRFKSDELNKLFAKPMPKPVRLKKLAAINNIPKEDYEDEELFELVYENQLDIKTAEKRLSQEIERLSRSRSHNGSNRSNVSSASSKSNASTSSSLRPPLVQLPNINNKNPPQQQQPRPSTSRTLQSQLVDIPEQDSLSLSSQNSDNSRSSEQLRPPSPPITKTTKTRATKNDRRIPQQKGADVHTDKGAPRRVQIQDPTPSTSKTIQPLVGYKNVGG